MKKKLEARYKKLKEEKGLQSEDTLQTFFALFDNCIQLYRLNKLSDYLEEVVPACRKRDDKYRLKAIQALAFVKWKQSHFREALPLFHEMEKILGKGAALCENIAHTYNSLGEYNEAEDYFRQALKFIEQEHGANRGNRGGVLLAWGLFVTGLVNIGKLCQCVPKLMSSTRNVLMELQHHCKQRQESHARSSMQNWAIYVRQRTTFERQFRCTRSLVEKHLH